MPVTQPRATACRVTVVNGTRRVDLALPSVLPISAVIPQLLRFCSPEERPERPVAWTLARLGGQRIGLGHSLADAGVLDGEVLELRPAGAATRPSYVEDVRDAVEDAVDDAGWRWRSASSQEFVLAVSAVGLALTALLPFARRLDDAPTLAVAALVAVLCVTGGWWGARRAYPVAAVLIIATGCLWGGIAGWLAALSLPASPPVALAAAAVAALVVAGAARIATPLAGGHLAALAVLAGAAVIAAVAGPVWHPLTPGRVAGVLAVLVIGVLPRVALSVGGLATADYRIRRSELVTERELADRIRQSGVLLSGAVLAVAAVGAVAGVALVSAGSAADQLLGMTIGVGLLLRSRVFSRIPHVAPLRVAGVVVLAAHGVQLGSSAVLQPWFVLIAATAAVGLVALHAIPLSDITRARIKRVLHWTESVVVVVMIAVAGAAVGLYDIVADFTN